MAASCLLRAVTLNNRLIFNIVQKEAFIRSIPCPAVSCALIASRSYTSFVGRVTADQLWAGVTSVSNPGRKRGRGRSVKKRVDLNRGQKIGMGKSGMVFPGLTGPALVGKKKVEFHQQESKTEEVGVVPIQRKRLKIPPLQRGYSGRGLPGTSIGPPDPIYDYVFEGFDTRVLEYKMVSHMTGNLGRKMRASALVITGNGKGLAGYAVAKAPKGPAVLRKAKNMAAQRLQYFERYNDHTVFHNFAVTEGKITVFVSKMPKGYGLRAHRVIKTICQIIGIEDLHAKVEGNTSNIQSIIKAFFRGLMEQETHKQLADRLQLNVVEFRPELENIPIPVATPSQGYTRKDPIDEEGFDYEKMYYKDGKIPLEKFKDPYEVLKKKPGVWKTFWMYHRYRNQEYARFLRMVHGLEPSEEEMKERKRPLK